MKPYLMFSAAMAAGVFLYESVQWFRPADYTIAAERWWFMTGGALSWILGRGGAQ